jgi:hypothetical protein
MPARGPNAASEINSGQAIGANTLHVDRQGSSQIRLSWEPLYGAAGFAPARLFRVWRRSASSGPYVQISETTAQHFTDDHADEGFVQYQVTVVR